MKKYILTAICALACTFAFGAKNTFTVISGSTDALKSAATYTTVFNYENVTIADMSLADFLASKDDKFREDWKNVIVPGSEAAGSNVMVIATDEKWMPETDGTADYTVTFNFKRMDLGYVAVFGGTKTGGAQFEGLSPSLTTPLARLYARSNSSLQVPLLFLTRTDLQSPMHSWAET